MKTLVTCLSLLAAPALAAQSPSRLEYRPEVVLQLPVADMERAIRFYVDVLEFTLTERRDDLSFAHIQTNLPGLEIGLSSGGSISGGGGAIVNISVADVASARAMLESRGVVFDGPTETIPGKVSLAGFPDPDGNRLRLAGPPQGNSKLKSEN